MTPDKRPENELLVCVARRSLERAQAERVRELVRSDLDWRYVTAMAHRHSVIPLLYYHVNALAPEAVPPEVLSQLRHSNDENTRQSLLLSGELLKLVSLLEAQGIPVIPFKGPTLAVCAYGDIGLRQFGDLDILVHKQDFLRVKELLAGEGFQPTPELTDAQAAALLRFDCAYNFANEKNVLLDIHWNFAAPYFAFQFDLDRIWERRETITIVGRKLPGLSIEDLLLVLCLHGSTHFWERLGWISDVAGLVDRQKNLNWKTVLRDATALGSKRMLLLGLFLAHELLEAPLTPEVLRTVQADPVIRTLAAQVQQRLFAPETAQPGVFENAAVQLRMRERKRDKLKSGLRLALTPRVYDWMLLPLPGSLSFLYYILRPLRFAQNSGAKFLPGSQARENPLKGK